MLVTEWLQDTSVYFHHLLNVQVRLSRQICYPMPIIWIYDDSRLNYKSTETGDEYLYDFLSHLKSKNVPHAASESVLRRDAGAYITVVDLQSEHRLII